MPSWAEHHADIPILQEIVGAHDVIAGLNLMIDVLNAWSWRWEQSDRMMHLIDAQERRITDPIGNTRVAYRCPECLVTHGISRAESDMAEARDPCIAAAVVALPGVPRPVNKLDAIAARIFEGDKAFDVTRSGFTGRADLDRMTQAVEL